MIAVLFEADALPQAQERYLQLAAGLTPLLSDTPGFIAIERFQSLSTPGKILSLSWWEDEASVANWQQNERHLAAQREGKALMNPLMILVKIIKLRWIHILSYDQMVSRKINNQTTRCANSIFYTTLFTNSAPNYT